MSQDHAVLQRKIEELRRMRDQLHLKAQLGRMETRELWNDLEKRWEHLEANGKRLARESGDALGGVADSVRENIDELRQGYERFASALRQTHPDGLWERFRNTFDWLVEGGQRASERVKDSFEELGDAARLRLEKARLERTLIRKCAELGTRVYALAKEPGLSGGRPQVLDDDRVKALLQEVGSLDTDLQKAASELPEPDRAEA